MSKCILLLVIISSFQSFSKGYSQDKISIKLNDVSLRTAFKEIEKKSNYRFLYNDALIRGLNNKVSIQFTDATISQVMPELLSTSKLSYQINANLVVIKSAENSNAVAIPIRGKVTDSKGTPLIGVSISEKNTTNGTISDIDGNFSLSVTDANAVLVFKYIGYGTSEITVGNQTNLNVTLTETASNLNEVIVVGYGTQRRATVVGAVSAVKGAELIQAPVPNISNSLSGRVAGVIGRQSSGGQPGNDNSTFSIRGINTTGTNTPLIVVDNIIRNNINQVDPNAIETVSILKDAAATAPYGLAGANGVVLITTKQGKTGAPTISLNSWYGTQTPTYLPKLLGPQDYMRLRNEAYYNENPSGATPPFQQSTIDNYISLNAADPDRYPIAKPMDIINRHAPQQNHNIQVAGGSDRIKFFTNLGFFNQKGMFDQNAYTRYTYSVNLEAKVTNTTTFTIALQGAQEKTENIDPDNNPGNLLRSTYKFIPTDPFLFSNGLNGASAGLSPLGPLRSGGYANTYGNTLLSTVTIDQKLPIKGLSIKGTFSFDPRWENQKRYHKPYVYYNVNLNTTPYTYTRAISTAEGPVSYIYLNEVFNKNQNFTYQGYLNYHNTFGKHDITALIVAEARNGTASNFNSRINNFAVDVDEFNFGSSNKNDYTITGTSSSFSQVGYVYRVTDIIADKYSIEVAGRYDGHYYFAPSKRYAYFPSVGANWIISKEKFMEKLTWINLLKLRGSWGKSGNLAGNPFQFVDSYQLNANSYAFNGNLVQGAIPNPQANPVITWEQAVKTDIGIESSMFNGLLNLEVSLWKQKRDGLLFAPTTTIPDEYGTTLRELNIGRIQSSGVEVTIGTSHKFANGLQLGFNGNFSYANNKAIEVFETAATYNNPNRRRAGRPWQSQFGYHSLGLFQQSDDKNSDGIIDAADGYTVTQFGVLRPGDIKYEDISGPNGVPDGKIDINDEKQLGNAPFPLINYGFNLTANWKGFDFNAFFQGTANSYVGTQGFLTVPFFNNNSNSSVEYFTNHWTPSTPNALYPKANQAPYSNNTQPSDFWFRDASYLRLRTVTLGYTIPSSIVNSLKIKTVRFYVTGQNLLTFSKLKFIDPELGGNVTSGAGINVNNVNSGAETTFPLQRSITFGLNATF